MKQTDRPDPRPGQVYWNPATLRFVVVCGRVRRRGWRHLSFPGGACGFGDMRYGHWRTVPRGYRLVKEPK